MVRNSTAARRGLTSITSSSAATTRLNLLSSFLCLLLTPSSNLIVNAQEEECSCSPREFFFKLDLSALCPSLPPPFPPNDVFTSGGVADYTCNIGPEPVPKTTDSRRYGSTRRRGLRSETLGMDLSYGSITDFFSETEVKDSRTVTGDDVKRLTQSAIVATEDTVPVSIYSVQFLEVDSDFNVINQDSAYVRNIDFKDGDIFNYTSIIAQDYPGGGGEDTAGTSAIPGGMNMVLRGVNAAGDPVRNVFTIAYNNDLCGTPTFEGGEAIGWVIFEDFVPATEKTCPRSAPTTSNPPITMFPTEAGPAEEPTTSPPNNEPTTSNPPITEPTPTPPMSIPYEIDYSAFDHHHHHHHHYYDKSGKGKGGKFGKGSKGSGHYSYNWGSEDGYRRMI